MSREKGRGRVGQGEDAWCIQYDSTQLLCSQRTVINSDASSEIVNPTIKLLYLGGGLEAQAKLHKNQVQELNGALHTSL